MAHAGGRPTLYTPELGQRICDAIATTTDSLQKICDDNVDFPSKKQTIHVWKLRHSEFNDLYVRAKQNQADLLAEEILEISDFIGLDTKVNFKTGEESLDAEWVARSRLRVDSRKWIACKLLPKVYGDKSEVKSDVSVAVHEDRLKDLR